VLLQAVGSTVDCPVYKTVFTDIGRGVDSIPIVLKKKVL